MKAKKAELIEERKRMQADAKRQQEQMMKTFESLKSNVGSGLDLEYVSSLSRNY